MILWSRKAAKLMDINVIWTFVKKHRCKHMWASISYMWWLSDLRPFSWAFLPWSKSAASLKETRRPVVPVERKRSVSWSWELAIDKHSDSSTLMVISTRDIREKRQGARTDRKMGEGRSESRRCSFYLFIFLFNCNWFKVNAIRMLSLLAGFPHSCFPEDESYWLCWSPDLSPNILTQPVKYLWMMDWLKCEFVRYFDLLPNIHKTVLCV